MRYFLIAGTWLYNVFVLSFLWCTSAVLVIPVGAGSAALCAAARRILAGDDTELIRRYFRDVWFYRFRGTVVFFGMSAFIAWLLLDIQLIDQIHGLVASALHIALLWVLAASTLCISLAFPLLVRYDGPLGSYTRRLPLIAMAALPRAILNVAGALALADIAMRSALFTILLFGGLISLWMDWNMTAILKKIEVRQKKRSSAGAP